ncbi:MAG: arsenate reductase ArsC [Chloroflexi bacterium]|nr:arsenate reductase ArsC [Chloroflexota bacterium]
MEKKSVLFLCTGNSARSQMAEAFLKKWAGDQLDVYSAGLEPSVVNPYTIEVMEEVGYDLSDQWSKSLREYDDRTFDYMVTVCSHAEENCPTGAVAVETRIFLPFEDPAAFEGTEEEKLNKFREIREQVELDLRRLLEEDVFAISVS